MPRWTNDNRIREVQVSGWIWVETLKEGKSTELLEWIFQQELSSLQRLQSPNEWRKNYHQSIRPNTKEKSKPSVGKGTYWGLRQISVWLFINFMIIFITHNLFTAFISSPGNDPTTQSCSKKQMRKHKQNAWK